MKRIFISYIAVFVAMTIYEYFVHTFIMDEAYAATAEIWRSDMDSKMWIFTVISIINTFFFTHFFIRMYEGRGFEEGARYGLFVGIWLTTGIAYGTYGMINIPYAMALQWWLYGVVGYVLYGVLLSTILGKKVTTTISI